MAKLLLILFSVCALYCAQAASTRTVDADSIRTSDASKTYSLPASAGTLALSYTDAQEIPSGSGTSFTLAHTPKVGVAVKLYIDGIYLLPGGGYDYTISGTAITLTTALATGQRLTAVYDY